MNIRRIFCVMSALLMAASFCACTATEKDAVYVQSVADLTGYGNQGVVNRFAGVVSAGETVSINPDDGMTLDEILVTEGQEVTVGDVLFTYDNEAVLLTIEQSELEVETMKNGILSKQNEIEDIQGLLEKAREDDDKLAYTLQIQELEADIMESEYNLKLKEKELESMKEASAVSEVTSPITGKVSALNKNYAENGTSFITIMSTDEIRVKGIVNELNFSSVSEGIAVTMYSRTDDSTWTGTITMIDWENPIKDNDGSMYYSYEESSEDTSETTQTSKYYFYVTPDDSENLFMGRHVYIMPSSAVADDDVLRLSFAFICGEPGSAYVWAENTQGKLEKRNVTLADYDPSEDTWAITSGLTADDWIAFPDENCKNGLPTTRSMPSEDGAADIDYNADFSEDGTGYDDSYTEVEETAEEIGG